MSQNLPEDVWRVLRDEDRRDVLGALGAVDGVNDPDFDRITRLAARTLSAPTALVTLVDIERQWFKSRQGIDSEGTPVEDSFCAHALADQSRVGMVVLDATRDERFRNNPLVTGPPGIRFYAGVPFSVKGQRLGTVCVIDSLPRESVDPEGLDRLVDLAGLVGTLFELKDEARVRARTAAALMREEWRHALTLEAGKVGAWLWDIRTDDVTGNDLLRRMFGIAADRPVTGTAMLDAVVPGDLPKVQAAFDAAFEQGVDYEAEFRVNSGRWLMGRGRVYQRDAAGKPLVVMGINLDITEAHEAASETRRLIRELNHRVKNTLAVIQSLARQTGRFTTNPADFLASFTGRLKALSDVHIHLANRDWSGVSLSEVIGHELDADIEGIADRVEQAGPEVMLPPDQAMGMALVLHELLDNARRHGALSVAGGRVRLLWSLAAGAPPVLTFHWQEVDGPPVRPLETPRLGKLLIERSLDKVLNSKVKLTFAPSGVEATIVVPLEA